MAKGKIVELKNNYGRISTDAYKVQNEWIPFKIEQNMLTEKEGTEYIKYKDEVEFKLNQSQGVRDRDIKEAIIIKFIGNEWKYQERKFDDNFSQIVRKRLDEYNFYFPVLDDAEFIKWLEKSKFQPRMLEYLSPGIFTSKKIIMLMSDKKIDVENINAKFKIELLWIIDRIDIEFRKNLLSWITSLENCYKMYFCKISISEKGEKIGPEIISDWASKKPKIKKLIKRARDKRKFRITSDEFDYLADEEAVPLFDLMEQLELNELSELINAFYNKARYLQMGDKIKC